MTPPAYGQRFGITLFRDEKDNAGQSCVLEWPELVGIWRDGRAPYAWAPATFNGTRAKANVASVSLLVLDVDGKNASGANVAAAAALWQRLGIATAVHSSKSHTTAAHCYRVVLRLSRPVTVAEHASVWTWATAWMASEGQACDVNARDASRLWFFGAEPRDGSPFVFCDLPGAPLDVDGVLCIVPPVESERAAPATDEAARVAVDPSDAEGQYRVAEFITRCREKLAPSIQGQYGSNKLLAAAGWGANYYELPADTVTSILWEHFNPRCLPPWELHEIQRKVSEAIRTAEPTRPKCPPRQWGESLRRRTASSNAPAAEPKGTTAECTDVANVEQLVTWYGGDLRYVTAWDKFIAWDGQRWVQDDSAPMRFATDTARRMLTLAQDEQRRANEACAAAAAGTGKPDEATAAARKRADRRVKHAIDSQSAPRLQAMVRLAKARPEFAIKHTDLDGDGMLLNVANGTVDLRTGELRPHERTDLITKLAPVAYDPSAQCPVWDRFLSSSMAGKASVIGFLQRAIGYSLTGETREHVLGFCFGSGANGKTTFLATIHEMLGEYAKPAARSLLMKKRGDEHPTALADLYGARFVTCCRRSLRSAET